MPFTANPYLEELEYSIRIQHAAPSILPRSAPRSCCETSDDTRPDTSLPEPHQRPGGRAASRGPAIACGLCEVAELALRGVSSGVALRRFTSEHAVSVGSGSLRVCLRLWESEQKTGGGTHSHMTPSHMTHSHTTHSHMTHSHTTHSHTTHSHTTHSHTRARSFFSRGRCGWGWSLSSGCWVGRGLGGQCGVSKRTARRGSGVTTCIWRGRRYGDGWIRRR